MPVIANEQIDALKALAMQEFEQDWQAMRQSSMRFMASKRLFARGFDKLLATVSITAAPFVYISS